MQARLYGMAISHPSRAAQLMLEHKGIDYDLVSMPPGAQAIRIPLAGFKGGTVPALRIGDRRALGSRAISRLLDEVQPDPPLFPRAPERRREVEAAEAWGDEVLQPIPRRLLRWSLRRDASARRHFAGTVGLPLPGLVAHAMLPVAAFYARREQAASTDRIRADWLALPEHLAHVDGLIASGTLGGETLNAADFQIGTTLRVMTAFEDYRPLIAGRPCDELARRVWPRYRVSVPPLLPEDIRAAASDRAA